MSNLQAALGLAQLERLDEFVARKRHSFARYMALLADVGGIRLPVACTENADNINWLFGVVLDDNVPFDAMGAMKRLTELGIGTRPFFWPMHEQPVFRRMGLFADERYPQAERIARRGFYLPSGLALTDDQICARRRGSAADSGLSSFVARGPSTGAPGVTFLLAYHTSPGSN